MLLRSYYAYALVAQPGSPPPGRPRNGVQPQVRDSSYSPLCGACASAPVCASVSTYLRACACACVICSVHMKPRLESLSASGLCGANGPNRGACMSNAGNAFGSRAELWRGRPYCGTPSPADERGAALERVCVCECVHRLQQGVHLRIIYPRRRLRYHLIGFSVCLSVCLSVLLPLPPSPWLSISLAPARARQRVVCHARTHARKSTRPRARAHRRRVAFRGTEPGCARGGA